MTIDEAVEFFGNATKLATALGIKPPSVSEWRERGSIPIGRQFQLQVITNGALSADPVGENQSDGAAA